MTTFGMNLVDTQDQLWIELDKMGNEMRLERTGRKLFPLLEYSVKADQLKKYLASLVFKNTVTGEESASTLVAKTGKELSEQPLSFAHVRITCDEEEADGSTILLEKHTSYIPVVRLYEETEAPTQPSFIFVTEAQFDHTKFKTVALYSDTVQDFKNKNNLLSKSRAKGWEGRKNWGVMKGEPSRKRRRGQNDAESEGNEKENKKGRQD